MHRWLYAALILMTPHTGSAVIGDVKLVILRRLRHTQNLRVSTLCGLLIQRLIYNGILLKNSTRSNLITSDMRRYKSDLSSNHSREHNSSQAQELPLSNMFIFMIVNFLPSSAQRGLFQMQKTPSNRFPGFSWSHMVIWLWVYPIDEKLFNKSCHLCRLHQMRVR